MELELHFFTEVGLSSGMLKWKKEDIIQFHMHMTVVNRVSSKKKKEKTCFKITLQIFHTYLITVTEHRSKNVLKERKYMLIGFKKTPHSLKLHNIHVWTFSNYKKIHINRDREMER